MKIRNFSLLTLSLTASIAGGKTTSTPLAKSSTPATPQSALFTQLSAEQTGITHINHMDVDHPMSYLFHSGMTCGGVAVADFDNDGKPDIFFAGATAANRLYRQTGDLKFQDITASTHPGLANPEQWSIGATAADVNGDGLMDLYVTYYMQPNQLFLNTGPGKSGEPVTFRECAAEAGLAIVDCSHTAAFADYDGDGLLDLYLLTNRIEDPAGKLADLPIVEGSLTGTSLPQILPEKARYYTTWRFDSKNWGVEATGSPDYLFRQTGVAPDGTPQFEDTTDKAGIEGWGDGLSVLWWDPDADGDPDLYVGNDFIMPDKWYENNGDGTFSNVLQERVPHTPWFSMGSDFGDANGDGELDLLVADMSATSHFKSKTTMGIMGGISLKRSFYDKPPQLMRNALYLSTGTDRYEEGAYSYKVSSTDWTWAIKFADYDLDGWQDVYFTNGISRHMNDSDLNITQDMLVGKFMFDLFKDGEMRKELNRAYQNAHGHKFTEVSEDWGLGHMGVTYASALADLDGDGDPDLISINLEEPDIIYRNDSQNPNRIAITLRGQGGNTGATGATVRIKTKSGSQIRHLSPTSGYLSCNEPVLLFGLGADPEVEELSIHWPHAGVQTLSNLKAGQHYHIEQERKTSPPLANKPKDPIFSPLDSFAILRHQDEGWEEDFTRPNQSLLPWALSQLGPSLASADVDGDGDSDFFLGSAAGNLAQLRLNQGDGKFAAKWVSAFATDKGSEDAGALFFDADNDGDNDLFVASGSNDFAAGAPENQDRLYLNDGTGNFASAPPGSLPEDTLIGSSVSAADFDRDGDLDLFVGTRLRAWSYPSAEASRLLINNSSQDAPRFAVASEEIMPELKELVTASLAIDLDQDGWVDLLTASEWGPVRWFKNSEGRLQDHSEEAGLAGVTGFWNSLTACDLDHDGDLDLIAGNLGLNSKYKQPSSKKPHLAYYGDFDGSGEQFVEVKREGECLYPERGRSCSSNAMPFIKEKFGSFKQFALAELVDIYEEEKLEQADQLSITEFQTGVFFNEGGVFTFHPLPREAQIAPVFGLQAGDFTGDGHPDLVLSGNFIWGPQIEAGPFDGGLGVFLTGDGKGTFTPLQAGESGLVLEGDHRALVRMDLDEDLCPDLLSATNNGPLRALSLQSQETWLSVRLPLNQSAGAIVSLRREGLATQTEALTLGTGYWSQNDSVAWFGLGENTSQSGTLFIRWPDGTSSEHPWQGETTLTLSKP